MASRGNVFFSRNLQSLFAWICVNALTFWWNTQNALYINMIDFLASNLAQFYRMFSIIWLDWVTSEFHYFRDFSDSYWHFRQLHTMELGDMHSIY